jgi:hypothetical protein
VCLSTVLRPPPMRQTTQTDSSNLRLRCTARGQEEKELANLPQAVTEIVPGLLLTEEALTERDRLRRGGAASHR